ncbi:hypothetical protein H920_03510 [Fukomys damarensis]|uniref:Uncharacterized protein n=1 Tax=Fukomys damarensis TaxID=885580 RepID=A0A091DVJ6_FUKDA|nr:hypothetical protein H920_03510 [Fukomys damarensis]
MKAAKNICKDPENEVERTKSSTRLELTKEEIQGEEELRADQQPETSRRVRIRKRMEITYLTQKAHSHDHAAPVSLELKASLGPVISGSDRMPQSAISAFGAY